MQNTPGMPHDLRFQEGTARVHVCLYGDVAHPVAQFVMDGACAEHPREAGLADHRMFDIRVDFGELRPYGAVRDLFDCVATLLKAAGWQPAPAIEGMPWTGNSLTDLADTRDFKFAGTPAESFPEEPSVSGFNAALGFKIILEQPGTEPRFSEEDLTSIRRLTVEVISLCFGHGLPEVEL